VHSCFPSRDLVSVIDPLVYPMGAWEPLLPPLGPSDLEFPFESISLFVDPQALVLVILH
jgi:hypothetical protein